MTTAKKTFDPWPAATVTAVGDILTNTDDGLSDREIDLLLERMEIADVDGPNDGPPPSRCGPVRRHSSSRRAVLLTVRGAQRVVRSSVPGRRGAASASSEISSQHPIHRPCGWSSGAAVARGRMGHPYRDVGDP